MKNELLNSRFTSVDVFGENYLYIEGRKFDNYIQSKPYIKEMQNKYPEHRIQIHYWHEPIENWKSYSDDFKEKV